jgi:hypothetical protein
MQSGNVEPARGGPATGGESLEVNAEQTRKTAASGNRQVATRKESTRPWPVRRADSPSWVEKIEQF